MRQISTSLAKKLRPATATTASEAPTLLPPDTTVDEEHIPDYNPHHFYPANPGDFLNNRYKTIVKLGWGSCSTVWLAQDVNRIWQRRPYVALKINNCDFVDTEAAQHELQISKILANTNPLHEGFPYVRTLLNSFEMKGPHGLHTCLVYEPMREPLWLFQKRCRNGKLSLDLIKVYLTFLLRGLDYLHSECHIVHTDLKSDNILVGFEDRSVIKGFVRSQALNPMARKVKDDRVVYRSHNEFGPLKSFGILPKIGDFGLAQRIVDSRRNIHPIQPDHYRAPEVIVGIGWSYSTDIWNLGVLIWNLLENKDLFEGIHSDGGKYDCQKHLAQMIALLGPPPKEFLDREMEARSWKWEPPIENPDGRVCTSVNEYFGGPFFDSHGKFLYKDPTLAGLDLGDSTPSLQGEEKKLFLEFVGKMLRWVPEDRMTARELLGDPWLLRDAPSKRENFVG
ncbi:hypothetical protein V491_00162 [Pseudogymnoascus sp. VKM F-3775]|nr:hypothetical protein V491_00162 [Pseudogymnoascus sp. VKM F-3775]